MPAPANLIRTVVKLPYTTGIAADVSENTYYFGGDGTAAAIASYWQTWVLNVYTGTNTPGTAPMGNYLAAIIDRGANKLSCTSSIVNQTTGHVSAPIATATATLAGAGSTDTVSFETALCGSFKSQTAINSGVNARSARGRVYFGPFNSSGVANTGVYPIPNQNLINAIIGGHKVMAHASYANGGAATAAQGSWCVWSPKLLQAFPIDGGWCDNAWDTQRRREVPATARNAWLY